MIYYLDGYNFLFLVSKEVENLEASRNAFLDTLSEHLGGHANLNIVFDAHLQDRSYATKILRHYFEVIFTPEGQTADEYIIERVEMHSKPAQIFVVSSDKHLLRSCQQLGAKTQTVQEFLHLKQKKKREGTPIQEFHESPREIERLLRIFEKKLKEL